jgi:hypothetical protein
MRHPPNECPEEWRRDVTLELGEDEEGRVVLFDEDDRIVYVFNSGT